jgi:hypothetical protein
MNRVRCTASSCRLVGHSPPLSFPFQGCHPTCMDGRRIEQKSAHESAKWPAERTPWFSIHMHGKDKARASGCVQQTHPVPTGGSLEEMWEGPPVETATISASPPNSKQSSGKVRAHFGIAVRVCSRRRSLFCRPTVHETNLRQCTHSHGKQRYGNVEGVGG